uniref:Potassium channel domain-containing protein n=1 Tax=Globodera rostochiensis TaxID=31243 RepID=A0A914H2J9_GLORO
MERRQKVILRSKEIGKTPALAQIRGVKWDDEFRRRYDEYEEGMSGEQSSGERETVLQKTMKYLKILLPHVGLNILLFTYISFGAIVFIFLEADNELEQRRSKVSQILHIYELIMNETVAICRSAGATSLSTLNGSMVERRMRPLLSVLSRTHEYDERFTSEAQMWSDSEDSLETKWTFAASSLYALTVITSTGYDHLTPLTDSGRIFTVFYGLLGIPLMFITAADIGKFLSDLVIKTYGKLLGICTWLLSVFDAIKDYIVQPDDESIESRKLRERRKRRRRRLDGGDEDEEDEDRERLQLPIFSYFALVVGYCAIGSLLFNWWERGAVWSFIHGLFFSFNTITTIGLGNICVTNRAYLALVILYVIIGLAVITASLDLCSSTLKKTFTKLHYFGRKIREIHGIHGLSRDMREAMKIISAMKKIRGSKERITLEDLKRFLEVQEHLLRQPYVPYNVHIFKWIEDAYMQYCLNNEETASLGGRSAHYKISPGKERLLPPPPPIMPNLHRSFTENSSAQNSVILY